MSDLKMTGEIIKVLELQKGEGKNGEWQKQTFVINNGNKYNPEVAFSIFGTDKVDNFLKYNKVGDTVEVSFNLSSREYNGNYFHNLDAWKVFKHDATAVSVPDVPAQIEDDSELPF